MKRTGALILATILNLGFQAQTPAEKVSVVPSSEASRESFQTNKRFNWLTNLDDARAEAARTGKLVFWVHMLGTMDGKT